MLTRLQIDSVSPRAGVKRVPRLASIDPNQRYTLDETPEFGRAAYLTRTRCPLQTIKDGRRRYILGSELIRRSRLSD
jgi:hypothetical protein